MGKKRTNGEPSRPVHEAFEKIVCKFGGSSVSCAQRIQQVAEIIQDDPLRQYIVVSAPGQRDKNDHRITQLLRACHQQAAQKLPYDDLFDLVAGRFSEIKEQLGLRINVVAELEELRRLLPQYSPAFVESRGEYFSARLIAEHLGATFVDAAKVIYFGRDGEVHWGKTRQAMRRHLNVEGTVVIPGFYGVAPHDCRKIKTFSDGGSDITGTVVAKCMKARVYQNWTDTKGVYTGHPKFVRDARPIEQLSFRELRELSYAGADVFHSAASDPLVDPGIPINVRSTLAPQHEGTLITSDGNLDEYPGQITGLAGRLEFLAIRLYRRMANEQVGFLAQAAGVLARHDVHLEFAPGGIDSVTLVLREKEMKDGKLEVIRGELQQACQPDDIEVVRHLALIAVVGRGIAREPGIAVQIFDALAEAKINVELVSQGASTISVIIGVAHDDFAGAQCAIHDAFFGL